MGLRTRAVNAYIGRAPEFARPILEYVRELVCEACPAVEETIKWTMPHFTCRGILCGVGAFKTHCAVVFWKGALVVGAARAPGARALGQFGRVTSLRDLPRRREFKALVRRAMALNDAGVPAPARAGMRRAAPRIPTDLGRSRATAWRGIPTAA